MAARVGRRRQSGRWRSRALVLPCGADPVQRCGAILLGQALRPPQGHAACQSEEDLGGADRRRRHDNARCGAAGPYLTPLDMRWSALASLILGIAGFLGDITMSAMKR